jgi:hypothetical protein
MDDTTAYDTSGYTDGTGYESTSRGYTDPISSFFGGIFFIIILVLLLIFVVIFMFYRGVSWVGSTVTGGARKEGFEMPKTGPQPCPEHDERCAHFPSL